MGLVADCTKADDAKMILDETIAKYGHVDGMINAGVHNAMPNGFGKMTEDYWKNAIEASDIHLSRLDQHGALGENLTIEGIVEDQAFVGDVWKINDVELEVTAPREPCFKFNAIMVD